jgi:multicomponent Na+:H+ antiporter subunit D
VNHLFYLLPLIGIPLAAGSILLFHTGTERYKWPCVFVVSTLVLLFASAICSLKHPVQLFSYRFTPIVTISFNLDSLGLLFSLLASWLWLFTLVYSHGYMRHEENTRRYLGFLLLSLAVTNGIALAGNLVTLFFFYEALTLTTYPLVIHRQTPEAMRAGIVYLAYNLIGATFVLLGIATLASQLQCIDFVPGGIIPADTFTPQGLLRLFSLLCIGFGVKSAVIPLHHWLPTAMVAPTPVSALLHAVAVVNAGVFGLFRTLGYVFGSGILNDSGLGQLLSWPMIITIVLGSIWAFRQDDLKRRLAYSTISQLAYMGLGASLLTPSGHTAALLHFFNHALLKITLFFCAGNLADGSGKTKVSELAGVGFRQPWTLAAFSVAVLGMIGLPPVNGFLSKWYLALGALEAGRPSVAGIVLLSALLNAGYFLPIVLSAFSQRPSEPTPLAEPPASMLLTTLILGTACVIFFIWPRLPLFLSG